MTRLPNEGEPPPKIPLVRGRASVASRSPQTVDLECEPGDLYLIINWPSAEEFSNQVGGYSCRHRSMRGLLLPLHQTPRNLVPPLLDLLIWMFGVGPAPTPNPKPPGVTEYAGRCNGLTSADADALDPILRFIAPACLRFLEVDRRRLDDSTEAWIHVVGMAYVTPDGQPVADPSRGPWSLVGFRGVLTWENSD